ncbi:MAG: hypothetical protein RLZZ237_2704, partial [Pseudomonadota bacterium]
MSVGSTQHRHCLQFTPLARSVSLAICSLALSASVPALAQGLTGQQVQGTRLLYNIPAGPLAPALRSLASAANVLLTYTPEQASGKSTAGLQGQHTPQSALAALLAGTGLQAVELEAGSYVLRAAPQSAAAAPEK